jgi:hypothetical protein
LIGIWIREWPQEYAVHYAEDGCVRTDAQSERHHQDRRESGPSGHLPNTVAEILEELVHVPHRFRWRPFPTTWTPLARQWFGLGSLFSPALWPDVAVHYFCRSLLLK